jgi:hypothetical protein
MNQASEPILDDASSAFVQWLTTRTLEGRAHWEKHPNGFISHLTTSTFVPFITHASPDGHSWRLFRVRDTNGEFLRTTPALPGTDTSPLAVAVKALFLTIVWAGPHLIH